MQFIKKLGIILGLFISLPAFGDVLDHLKAVEGKSDAHKMRNIDFIYMINLDQRPEKFQKSQELLNPYMIYPYRFSAVNGWELSLETIYDVGIKYKSNLNRGIMSTYYPLDGGESQHEYPHLSGRTYFCHCMSRGAIGIVLSHLSILQDAYNSGYETIWVMEDDIQIVKDPRILPYLIDELDRAVGKDNWDILFTDRDTRNNNGKEVACTCFAQRPNFASARRVAQVTKINSTFRKIEARYGAYSMIVRRSGMKKILDFYRFFNIYLPYDMDIFLLPNLHSYTVWDEIVTTRLNAESDNGGPNYLNKKEL